MTVSHLAERSAGCGVQARVGSMLETSFDLMAGAPQGVTKLRELILVLAMRGKVSSPKSGDEKVELLLTAISNQANSDAGRLAKKLPDIAVGEVPYSIPARWKWARLGRLGRIVGGGTPKSDDPSLWASGSGVPWVTPADLYGLSEKLLEKGRRDISDIGLKRSSAQLLPAGSVLFSSRAPIGYVAISTNPIATNQGFKSCVPHVPGLADYLYWFLKYAGKGIDAAASGTTFKEISGAEFSKILVPLPPLAEQARIVARVEELMQLCDALEAQGRLQDEQHARLVATLFDALAASESAGALAENWQRIATHFDLLLDRTQAIDTLEQTLLQLAVRGLLVPQDPNDQPAPVKAAKTANRGLTPPGDDETPFAIPPGWQWARLGWLAEFINGDRGKNYPNRAEYVPEGLPFINTGHIEPDGTLSSQSMNYLTRKKFESLRSGKTHVGDLVYCLRGATLGKTAIVDYTEGAIASSLVIIRLSDAVFRKYAYYYLISPLGKSLVKRFDNGSAQPNLAATSVQRYVFPLPPLAEQQRIVARVEELRRLCANLRERLQHSRATQAQLADALVSVAAQSPAC